MNLRELLTLEEPDHESLAALHEQAALMARAGVVIPIDWWVTLPAWVRLVLVEEYELHSMALVSLQGSAAQSVEGAAAAYAPVDGGQQLTRLRLERMAEEALQ